MTILFHCVHDTISLAMFEDLALALNDEGHDVRFTFNGGIAIAQCEAFCAEQGFPIAAPDWEPDVMFVADFRCYTRRGTAFVIDIGHGIGSKHAYYYQDTQYGSDAVFFPSEYLAQLHSRPDRPPFYGVGMPKLDRAVRLRATRPTPEKPVVVVAPTFNKGYNCLEMIAESLPALAADYRIIVKPHEYFYASENPTLKAWVPFFTNPPEGVEVIRDYNLANLFGIADVVISDVSSAFMEAIGVGIPTIVCQTQQMRDEAVAQPWRNEWVFQPAAHICTDATQLTALLARAAAGEEPAATEELRPKILSNPGTAISTVLNLLPTLV